MPMMNLEFELRFSKEGDNRAYKTASILKKCHENQKEAFQPYNMLFVAGQSYVYDLDLHKPVSLK